MGVRPCRLSQRSELSSICLARRSVCLSRKGRPMASAAAGTMPAANHRLRRAFKDALRSGSKPQFGLFLNSASPLVAEQLSIAGYDWVVVDAQHSPLDYSMLAAMLTACAAGGTPAIVRVGGPEDRPGIQQALDLGAAGIMVPTVNSPADVAKCVGAARFPTADWPGGTRSISWPIRPQFGRDVAEFIHNANEEVVVMAQVETRPSYEDVEAVAGVPGLDAIFVGPVDLSHSLGLHLKHGWPGAMDSPEFQEVMARISAACRKAGVAAGSFAVGEARAKAALDDGFQLLAVGTDIGLLAGAAEANLASVRRLQGRT